SAGHTSITAVSRRTPKNLSVSSGWRAASRVALCSVRCGPASAARNAFSSAASVAARTGAQQASSATRRTRARNTGTLALRLLEQQREAVAFSNCGILVAILLALEEGGRQRPDALRIVLGVLRVGVDFGLADQLEARALD